MDLPRIKCGPSSFHVSLVHIKLVFKSDTVSLMNAILCFSARHPGSTHFTSDQGTNLTKADKDLKELREWNDSAASELRCQGIQWSFITAGTPHRGGCYERVVGLFKHHLATMKFGDAVHVKTFETALIQDGGFSFVR